DESHSDIRSDGGPNCGPDSASSLGPPFYLLSSSADILRDPGYGTVGPLIVRHRILLKRSSSAASAVLKSRSSDSCDSRVDATLRWSSGTDGISARYGLRSAPFAQISRSGRP